MRICLMISDARLMQEQLSAALQPMKHRRKSDGYTKRIITVKLAGFGWLMQLVHQSPLAIEDYKMICRLLED